MIHFCGKMEITKSFLYCQDTFVMIFKGIDGVVTSKGKRFVD
jgi:hypothetical protein